MAALVERCDFVYAASRSIVTGAPWSGWRGFAPNPRVRTPARPALKIGVAPGIEPVRHERIRQTQHAIV